MENMNGSFRNVDVEYKVVRNIITELEELGFVLTNIRLSGYQSSHDWEYAYKKQYSSFEEFLQYAMNDYENERSKISAIGAEPDWSFTVFELSNKFSVCLCTDNDVTCKAKTYKAWWTLFAEDTYENDVLLQKTLEIFKRYE